jgi:hypothetical protein
MKTRTRQKTKQSIPGLRLGMDTKLPIIGNHVANCRSHPEIGKVCLTSCKNNRLNYCLRRDLPSIHVGTIDDELGQMCNLLHKYAQEVLCLLIYSFSLLGEWAESAMPTRGKADNSI